MNKKILIGVTGGIAAYKCAELIRRLREQGAFVRVVMTAAAKQFITPLTLPAVSGNPVADDLFDLHAEAAMGHIELARWPDLIIIAPASADFIARFTYGHANDLLMTLCLATKTPIMLAPAMNQVMWQQAVTQENIQRLHARGIKIIGPGSGSQACGEVGPGRMLEPAEIVNHIYQQFHNQLLVDKKILITAGPTREPIDPVRFLTNRSSGKMGYALTQAAVNAGAQVTLISGPTALTPPEKINFISVITAKKMYSEVMACVQEFDIFISVAAVSDYRIDKISDHKIKKLDSMETLMLTLKRNPDILQAVANLKHKPFLVGFAAETENLIENARKKLQQKKLDMIVANLVGPDYGFQQDKNSVTILSQTNKPLQLPLENKQCIAEKIIFHISKSMTSYYIR